MQYEYPICVLTPTYNRRSTLPKVYESLKAQTCKEFQWLIVDDGSTDATREYCEELCADEAIKTEYVYKTNGGKHTALNYSHDYIKGEIVLILDSDDQLTPDAIEIVLGVWEKYKTDEKICGLSFLRGYDESRAIANNTFPEGETRSNHIDFRINSGISGDCCEVIRTDVLKEFPFPVFEGERFIGENCLWVSSALKYDTVYIGKIIYICEYLEGGLTKSGRAMRMKCPNGGMESSKVEMIPEVNFKQRFKKAILYSCYGFAAKMKLGEIMKTSGHPFLVMLGSPAGFFFYKKWSKE